MLDNKVLADPAMAIDPVHDNRHALDERPHARESIPYIVVLPEHQIGFFTYTWVDAQNSAGAAISVFGPGVGTEGFQQRLPDRPISPDMGFDEWAIEDFRMEQDLKFDKAHLHWKTPEATVEFSFEASHPPYAYATDPRGCPAYVADNRIEQAGRASGILSLGGKVIEFEGTGHRDHSWGTRDWAAMQHYNWFVGQVGDEIAIHFWNLYALGQNEIRGYVYKDGLMALVDTVDVKVEYNSDFWQTGYLAKIIDKAGRETTVRTEVFGHSALVPDPKLVLRESAGAAVIDGKAGVGWMECAWPTDYLEHLEANGPY